MTYKTSIPTLSRSHSSLSLILSLLFDLCPRSSILSLDFSIHIHFRQHVTGLPVSLYLLQPVACLIFAAFLVLP